MSNKRGKCPACGGEEIVEWKTGGGNDLPEFTCCLGCLFYHILIPIAILMEIFNIGQRPKQTHRRCESCGHQWLC